ncbi:MAG: aminoacyl-tRNA hydrolase, partial [Ilumatobacteraceae bacterium]|nr:aminoacyl-tRNA hydrolase [Ilumatobacteraceae bacterium]
GQHVNKTSSKAMLTVVVNDVIGTPEKIERLRRTLGEEIRIMRDGSRSQWRNRQSCLSELAKILDSAAAPPPLPRRKSRPTRGSIERRLSSKRKDSEKKTLRRTKDW